MGRLDRLGQVVANLRIEQHSPGEIRADRLQRSGFARARLSPVGFIGLRMEGAEAFSDLAHSLFQSKTEYRRGCKLKEFASALFEILIQEFAQDSDRPIAVGDLTKVEQAIADWYNSHSFGHNFYIPCVLTPRSAPTFAIGPVRFQPLEEFVKHQQIQLGEEFEIRLGAMVRDTRTKKGDWIAEVDVSASLESRAEELGNLAVDVALTGIQLAAHPPELLHHLARTTSRMTAAFKMTASRRSDGGFSSGAAFTQSGLLLLEGNLQRILQNNAVLLKTLGRPHSDARVVTCRRGLLGP
jgi:hypothetical protein